MVNQITELTVLVVDVEVLETGDGEAVAAAAAPAAAPAGAPTAMDCDQAEGVKDAGETTPVVKREKTAGTAVARQGPQSPGPTPSPSE